MRYIVSHIVSCFTSGCFSYTTSEYLVCILLSIGFTTLALIISIVVLLIGHVCACVFNFAAAGRRKLARFKAFIARDVMGLRHSRIVRPSSSL